MTTPKQPSRSALSLTRDRRSNCRLKAFTEIHKDFQLGIRRWVVALMVFSAFNNYSFSQCASPGVDCNGSYNNIVICEVSGDSGQSDGSNDAIVELCGPAGAAIGCMVVSNGEWAVVLPSSAVIPTDGVYLITCSADINRSSGTGIGSAPNGQIAAGNGDYNAGFTTEIDFDVCDPANANFYDPAASGFTLDNTSATDGDVVVLFQPDGTVHDALAWSTSPGAIGNADNCLIQSGPYTLGDNDGNGIVNDNPAAIPMGRCDGSNAIAVPLMPAGDCNADQVCYTLPRITNAVYTILNPNNKGCNSSYIRLNPGTSQGGQNGAPSHADGKFIDQELDDNGCPISVGNETQESFTSDSFTPSACGANASEWAYTDHPTPGQRNDDPTFTFYINNSVLCMPGEIEICAEVYNYQHVSDNMDTRSGTDNGQTGSYVFNPITDLNETWDTYEVSGETTTLCKKINITEPGAYSFGAVIDDYSNCCGTSGDPHSQSNPNECYETQNFFVTLLEPALYDCDGDGIADDPQVPCSLSCDPGPPTPGVINAMDYIVGGGNLQFQLIDNSGSIATVSNSSGIFNIPDDVAANAGYRIDVIEMASCGFSVLSIAIDDNCEIAPICPESVVVTVDGGTGPVMACPDTEIELCFDGNQLPSGGSLTWEVDEGTGFEGFESIPIPSNDPEVFVYISAVYPDPATTGSESIALCGSRTEWIILTNADPSNSADISGYTLEDNSATSFFTVPAGTIIPAGGTYLVCVGSVSRLANTNDFANLYDAMGTLISDVVWTSNPGDDTSAGSDTPPIVTPADPGYNSDPAEKEFCALFTIPSAACPSMDLEFRAVIDPFASSCPDTDPDVASPISEVLEVTVNCPTASIASTGVDVCAVDMTSANLPITINGGEGPFTVDYTVDGISNTSFGISSGDNLMISGPTIGDVKVILNSITDENGANCSGSVSDAEVCVNIRPSVELTINSNVQPTACMPCDGMLTFDLTGTTTSSSEFDIDYTINGTSFSLAGVVLPFTLTGLCPGSYDITAATDDAGCDMTILGNPQTLEFPSGEPLTIDTQPAPICGTDGSIVDLTMIDYNIDFVASDFVFYSVDPGMLPASVLTNTPPLLTSSMVVPTMNTTYYVVYTDPMTGCESMTTIQITIDNSLCCDVSGVNEGAFIRGCEDPLGSFMSNYDLTDAEDIANGDVDGDGMDGSSTATVTYYMDEADAMAGTNQIPNGMGLTNAGIFARVSFGASCFSVVAVNVQLFQEPSFDVTVSPATICDGTDGSIRFTNLSAGGKFLVYTGPQGSLASGAVFTPDANGEFLLSDLTVGTYMVSLENRPTGLMCASEFVEIEIGEPDAPTITVNDPVVCAGTTEIPIEFMADCTVEHFLVEYDDAANTAGLVDMNSSGSAIGAMYMLPDGLAPGVYNGTVVVVCDNFCNDIDDFTITVVETPEITLTQDTDGCTGEELSFSASPTGLVSYTFYTDVDSDGVEEILQSGLSEIFTTTSLPDGEDLFVRATILGDCIQEATMTVSRMDPCPIYDVALMKVLESSGPFGLDDLVEFQIEVFNQSNQPVYNIQVADYLPLGLDFFAADNMSTAFAANPDTPGGNTVTGMAVTTTALPAGESLTMSIFLRVGVEAINGTLFNAAEIIAATQDPEGLENINDQDDDLEATDGGLADEDDNNVDDETAGGTDNAMDEDDFDFAALQVCTVGCNGTFPWNGQN